MRAFSDPELLYKASYIGLRQKSIQIRENDCPRLHL